MNNAKLRIAEKCIAARYAALLKGVRFAADSRDESLALLPDAQAAIPRGYRPGPYSVIWKNWIKDNPNVSSQFRKRYSAFIRDTCALRAEKTALENNCAEKTEKLHDKAERLAEALQVYIDDENKSRGEESRAIQKIKTEISRRLTIAKDEHVVALYLGEGKELSGFIDTLPTAAGIAKELKNAGFRLTSLISEGPLLGGGSS